MLVVKKCQNSLGISVSYGQCPKLTPDVLTWAAYPWICHRFRCTSIRETKDFDLAINCTKNI